MRTAVAFVLAGCLTLAAGCTRGAPQDRRTPEPSPSVNLSTPPDALATAAGPFAAGPVKPPANGALLGAWVRPDALTQPLRVAAVQQWEAALGRPLDIVHTYKRLDEPFFTDSDLELGSRATLMLSWAGGDSRSVMAGRHDALIRDRARKVRQFGKPVLLRYRWEMDRPNLAASVWSPEDYIAAWKHVRRLFAAEGAHNVSWVWCPTVEGFERGNAATFYPGDDTVDWICVDVYSGARLRALNEQLRPFLQWSATHPTKPVMIGEFGVAKVWGPEQRAAWLRHASSVFKANPQIKAALYYESNPEGNGSNGQFRLADDPDAMAAFVELAREPYFNAVPR
jgi:glycosyl hydrolase family 26